MSDDSGRDTDTTAAGLPANTATGNDSIMPLPPVVALNVVAPEPVPRTGGLVFTCLEKLRSCGCSLGLVCMFVSCVMFAFVSIVVKRLLNDGANVWVIVFWRNAVQIALGTTRMRFQLHITPFWGAPERRKWLVMRGVTGGSSIVLYYAALALIPVTIATVLDFTDPVWTALLALYVLKERVTVWHGLAVALCLTGALFCTQPPLIFGCSSCDDEPVNGFGVVLGLGGAVTAALSYIAMRKIQKSEPTDVLVLYLSVVCAGVSVIPMLVLNAYPSSASDWFLLLLIGAMAYVGQCLQTYGFQTTPAALASTLNYVQLILTTVLAVVFYAEIPNAWTVIGCLLIIASTLALVLAQRKPQAALLPPAPAVVWPPNGDGHDRLAAVDAALREADRARHDDMRAFVPRDEPSSPAASPNKQPLPPVHQRVGAYIER